jgi:hypothetical protein
VPGGGGGRVVNNQLIQLSCAGSELLPRRNLCPDEEEVRVNGQLIQLSCAGSELLPRISLCPEEEEEVRVVNNQLIKLSCAGSELWPRTSLCPDEEEVRVNGQLGKEETRGTKLSQSRISSDRLSRNEDHLRHCLIAGVLISCLFLCFTLNKSFTERCTASPTFYSS